MKFSVAVCLFFALVAIARGGNSFRARDDEVELGDPTTLQVVLEFTPDNIARDVSNDTEPVTLQRIIDDVDVVVTRAVIISDGDSMVPTRRPLDDIGIPVTRNVVLSDLPPTPPIYTTPPVSPDTTPGTTTTEDPNVTTEEPEMTPYDRNRLIMLEA